MFMFMFIRAIRAPSGAQGVRATRVRARVPDSLTICNPWKGGIS